MNQFLNLFGQRIKDFWGDTNEQGKSELFREILNYANAEPQNFKNELREIQFDKETDPLPVVLEALSKDTENWGNFFVEQLDEILNTAKEIKKPSDVLTYLMEYSYIENDQRPFVQQIVDRLFKALDSENSVVSRAAIWTLPSFMNNESVRDKSIIIKSLHQKLYHKSWKIRYVTYEALKFENLLPENYRLKLMDNVLSMVFGKPYDFM